MNELSGNEAIRQLQEIPARRLLSAMGRDQATAHGAARAPVVARARGLARGPEKPSLNTLLRAAETTVDAAGNQGLTVSFKKVRILDAEAGGLDWERGEVYVVTSILDGSGKQPDFKTQLFEGIHDGDFLPLGDGGMLVGMLQNPRWFLDVHMLIMESDSDLRALGQVIGEARKQSGVVELAKAAGARAAFDPTMVTKILGAVDAFLVVLSTLLAENGDDHIATVHDFYLKHQGFGAGRHPKAEGSLARFQEADVAYQIDLVPL